MLFLKHIKMVFILTLVGLAVGCQTTSQSLEIRTESELPMDQHRICVVARMAVH